MTIHWDRDMLDVLEGGHEARRSRTDVAAEIGVSPGALDRQSTLMGLSWSRRVPSLRLSVAQWRLLDTMTCDDDHVLTQREHEPVRVLCTLGFVAHDAGVGYYVTSDGYRFYRSARAGHPFQADPLTDSQRASA